MKIKIEKSGKGYRADFIELPGSPTVGQGKTKEEAVVSLFIRQKDNLDRLSFEKFEIIYEK